MIGVTIFSIVTGNVTFEIQSANSPATPELDGARVGALRHRTHDGSIIAKRGGMLFDVKEKDDLSSIYKMIGMLRRKEIDGFVIDRYTFITFHNFIDSVNLTTALEEHKMNIHFIRTKTIQTEKISDNEPHAYGMLVRDIEDYAYFIDFMMDNWEALNTCNALSINRFAGEHKIERHYTALFDISSGFFWPSFYGGSITIIVLWLIGTFYEFIRRKHGQQTIRGLGSETSTRLASKD